MVFISDRVFRAFAGASLAFVGLAALIASVIYRAAEAGGSYANPQLTVFHSAPPLWIVELVFVALAAVLSALAVRRALNLRTMDSGPASTLPPRSIMGRLFLNRAFIWFLFVALIMLLLWFGPHGRKPEQRGRILAPTAHSP